MRTLVQKYGGSSLATTAHIARVAERVGRWRDRVERLVVVCSAMGGETDRLLQLAGQLDRKPSSRELDVLLTTGEQVSVALLTMALEARGIGAISLLGDQIPIITDDAFGKARIRSIGNERMEQAFARGQVVVAAGFQGVDAHGNRTTLGRGGSDTTAVALAACLHADECQIYTDVDGVYTADPRIVPHAARLQAITLEEMLELASLGSKVLQMRSVAFAGMYHVPVRVLSSMAEGPGTLICLNHTGESMEEPLVSGIAHDRQQAQITVLGVPDRPGVAFQILEAVAAANIEVDMIVQNVSGATSSTTDLTFTCPRADFEAALELVRAKAQSLGAHQVSGNDQIAKVSIVGMGMRSHAGVASHMFAALAREGINILMISTSEIKISVVVAEKYLELAVRTLHEAFHLEEGACLVLPGQQDNRQTVSLQEAGG